MAGLFEETERLKIRFLRAYERLYELGMITADQLDDVVDAIDRMDELTDEEFRKKLGQFAQLPYDGPPSSEPIDRAAAGDHDQRGCSPSKT